MYIEMEDGRSGEIIPVWLAEAADTVVWRWSQLENARTLLEQADALTNLSNAMSDLATFVPGYNMNTGEVERPGDET